MENESLQQTLLPSCSHENSHASPETLFPNDLPILPNRQYLIQELEEYLTYSSKFPEYGIALVVLDLDHFKVINNSLGILVADQLLAQVGQRLQTSMRCHDHVLHLGGDEFAFVIKKIQSTEDLLRVTSRIHEALMAPFYLEGHEVFVSASMGVTSSYVSLGSAEDFFRDADIAMNRAKSLGRSCCVVFQPEMHRQVVERLDLGNSLKRTLDKNEFFLEFQPIVSVSEEYPVGFEALIRWAHPDKGIIPPSEFIPLAEELGLINSIGQWVMEEACRQLKEWQFKFKVLANVTVSINLSTKQFFNQNLLEQIKRALEKSQLSANCLIIEITEHILLESKEKVISILEDIRSLGVQIAIDDFGTGYSSLSYLANFPFDILKIDASFTDDIENNYKKFCLVKAIIAMSHDLHIKVVAEGIESEKHAAQFKALNCEYGQGYFFSRSLSAEKAENYIRSNLNTTKFLIKNSQRFKEQVSDLLNNELVTKDQLLIQIENLKLDLDTLKQENRDLELLLEMANNHADVIETELYEEIISHEKSENNLKITNRKLHELSYTDSLTQIANRRYFDKYLRQEWQNAIDRKCAISLILTDVDHFKLFNDEYGHQIGDYCLIKVAQALSTATQSDKYLPARYGGEEFGIILPGVTHERAVELAAKVGSSVKSLGIPHACSPVSEYVTISSGVVSTVPSELYLLNHFVNLADKALYSAKAQGRDCFNVINF